MLRKFVLAALAAGAFAMPAHAVDLGGTYRVKGENPNGSTYSGTVKITVTSKNTCRIVWNVGSTSSGICMRNGPSFAASYVMGKYVGLVIYEIQDDGSLVGLWTVADQDGVGKETLIPSR